ncbi:MAG: peptidylprolyl isomerase, partial [Thermoplasmatota archaeon]
MAPMPWILARALLLAAGCAQKPSPTSSPAPVTTSAPAANATEPFTCSATPGGEVGAGGNNTFT